MRDLNYTIHGIAVTSTSWGWDPRCLSTERWEKCTFMYFYYERVGLRNVTDNFRLWLPAFPCHSSYLTLHCFFSSLIIYALFFHLFYAVCYSFWSTLFVENKLLLWCSVICFLIPYFSIVTSSFSFYSLFFLKTEKEMTTPRLEAFFLTTNLRESCVRMINRKHRKWYSAVIISVWHNRRNVLLCLSCNISQQLLCFSIATAWKCYPCLIQAFRIIILCKESLLLGKMCKIIPAFLDISDNYFAWRISSQVEVLGWSK